MKLALLLNLEETIFLSTERAFSLTWCAALEDFENCFSKILFKSTCKVTCELELKGEKACTVKHCQNKAVLLTNGNECIYKCYLKYWVNRKSAHFLNRNIQHAGSSLNYKYKSKAAVIPPVNCNCKSQVVAINSL